MSWVFLTEHYAWKLKKDIRANDLLDFSTLEKREYYSREELRLNRRLAPDIYLDVMPLVRRRLGHFSVGGNGEIVDWLLKMKRLPAAATLQARLEKDVWDEKDLQSIAAKLMAFFEKAERLDVRPDDYIAWFRQAIDYNFTRLFKADFSVERKEKLRYIRSWQLAFLDKGKHLLVQRAEGGKIIEGHGDLRPEHIYLINPAPVIIDCIEFNRSLRLVDMADELSFLQMMCASLDHEDAGAQIFNIYRHKTGDDPPKSLTAFYAGFRAITRTRLALRHMQDVPESDPVKWDRRLQLYLDLAYMYGQRQNNNL